jgi:hypothetical protein
MASVYLRFVTPDVDDLVTMNIYEGTDPAGSFHLIESVTNIGIYPEYIDNYTTNAAASNANYFCIEFIDNKGASTNLSAPVKGDVSLAVSEIQQRVLERDNRIDERVALQETESALQWAFPGYDPYDAALTLTYVEKRGITNLTLAMCYLTEMAHTMGGSWVAGVVSLKVSDQAIKMRAEAIDKLILWANRDLGTNFSMVAYLQDLVIAGGMQMATLDQSRLMIELR